jgi:hypothetical protein
MTSRGRVRPGIATLAVSALIAVSGATQWHALYAQAKNMPAKNGVSTIAGCVQSAQGAGGSGGSGKPGIAPASYFANGVFTVQSIKETSGTCAGDGGK